MASSWISCSACSTSNSTQDTVKVDPKLRNKENVQPLQAAAQREAMKASEEQRQREQARQRKDEAFAAAATAETPRQHEEAEKRKADAEKVHREEVAHRAAELAAASCREEDVASAAAAVARAAQAEQWRQEVAEELQRRQEVVLKAAQEKVNAWCKEHGFKDMNTSKKTYTGGVKFPLHTAVKHNNQEIIGMMLLLGVQKDVSDSKSQTPRQLAEKLNKNGSHGQILTMLHE